MQNESNLSGAKSREFCLLDPQLKGYCVQNSIAQRSVSAASSQCHLLGDDQTARRNH